MGCPKNLVDTEASLSLLVGEGCIVTDDPNEAELLIVNACSFLDAAWQETVEEVERFSALKAADASKKLIVMGCLPKHRSEDWRRGLSYVDKFLSAGDHGRLPSIVRGWQEPDRAPPSVVAVDAFDAFENRMLLTPAHTAYVKIAEGCSRRCSFCAIPRIRGRMVSRPVASVVSEIEGLHARGVKEVSLLAQDITSYYSGGARFADLVEAIASTGIDWIRIFYVHPGSLTMDLARRIFVHPSVCRYLESPIQHASDSVLKRMRRPYTLARMRRIFGGIRQEFPDVRIRSEVIVGFPGESDDDFDRLKDFVEEAEFASLGIFAYSPESNTAASELDGAIPEELKAERAAELTDLQNSIAFGLNDNQKGTVHQVLVDRYRADADDFPYAGRYYGQAPDVDGEILLRGSGITVGEFASARITDCDVFDLHAEVA